MPKTPFFCPAAALCLALIMLSACASGGAERFYVIEALPACTPTGLPAGDTPVLGVGPIEIPAYLDRPQIITRVRAHELMLNEHALWAEPLEKAVARVIALNLGALTGAVVEVDPWRLASRVRYRLSAQLGRLDGALGGDAVLDIRWSLRDERSGESLITRETHLSRASGAADFQALAAAYSSLLAEFSREVAGELMQLPR
ncbi:MAG TPA: PqiC family protein [Deltaproteobacteria bacterium]|nr:PqiC family protein [Deltaproteobacteria bacterium]